MSSCLFTTECKYSFLFGADLTIKFSFQISRIIVSFGSLHMHKMIAMNFLLFFSFYFQQSEWNEVQYKNCKFHFTMVKCSIIMFACDMFTLLLAFVVRCHMFSFVVCAYDENILMKTAFVPFVEYKWWIFRKKKHTCDLRRFGKPKRRILEGESCSIMVSTQCRTSFMLMMMKFEYHTIAFDTHQAIAMKQMRSALVWIKDAFTLLKYHFSLRARKKVAQCVSSPNPWQFNICSGVFFCSFVSNFCLFSISP